MYCIPHKIIRLSQVICANGSRKLFRFRIVQFSGLKYYFTWEITPFRNLFSDCPGFRYTGGPFQAGFTVFILFTIQVPNNTNLLELTRFFLIIHFQDILRFSTLNSHRLQWLSILPTQLRNRINGITIPKVLQSIV